MRILQLMSFAFVFVIFLFSRFTNRSLYVFLFPLLFFLYFSYLASLLASLLPCCSFYTSSTLLFFLYQLLPCLSLPCLSCLCAFFSRFRFFCPFSLLFFLYFSYLASLPASLLPRYSFYTSPTLLFFLFQHLPCLSVSVSCKEKPYIFCFSICLYLQEMRLQRIPSLM